MSEDDALTELPGRTPEPTIRQIARLRQQGDKVLVSVMQRLADLVNEISARGPCVPQGHRFDRDPWEFKP